MLTTGLAVWIIYDTCLVYPPRPRLNGRSLFSRMMSVRLYVRLSEKQKHADANVGAQKTKHALRRTLCENNDHLLAGAWWVTLKSSDLLFYLTC